MDSIYKKLNIPHDNQNVSITVEEAAFIYQFVKSISQKDLKKH